MKHLKSYTKLFESKADNIVEDCKDILAELSDDGLNIHVSNDRLGTDEVYGQFINIVIRSYSFGDHKDLGIFKWSDISEYIIRIFNYMRLNNYVKHKNDSDTMIILKPENTGLNTHVLTLFKTYLEFDESDLKNEKWVDRVSSGNIESVFLMFSPKNI